MSWAIGIDLRLPSMSFIRGKSIPSPLSDF